MKEDSEMEGIVSEVVGGVESDEDGVLVNDKVASSTSSVDSELEEDDRELISENLGPRGFRRLQQRGGIESDEEDSEEEENDSDDEVVRPRRKRVAAEELEKLFDDDTEAPVENIATETPKAKASSKNRYDVSREHALYGEDSEDELGDFIEEDSDEEPAYKTHRQSNKDKKVGSSSELLKQTFGGRLSARVLNDILDIFGDGTDYLGLVDEDDDEMQVDDIEKSDESESLDNSEVEKAKKKVVTTLTIDIVECDLPERVQLRDGRDRMKPEIGEIEMEASWIANQWRLDPAMEKFSSTDESILNSTISSVISLFREDNLEVPTVATHRKEYFQHLLGLNDLWSIWDLDEVWKIIKRQQSALLSQYDDIIYGSIIRAADSLENLEIVSDYLRLRKKKAAMKDAPIEMAIQAMADSFTLKVDEFVENIRKQQVIHRPPTPEAKLTDLSERFREGITLKSNQLVNAVIMNTSEILGRYPDVQMNIRRLLERQACITVTPTERGKVEIDDQHDLSPIKYVTNKPINAFEEDQFLLLVKGADLKLLTFDVVHPNMEGIMKQLNLFYGANGEWDEIRGKIVQKAMDEFILPHLKRDILAKLRANAEKWLSTAGQYLLQDKLMVLPSTYSRVGAFSLSITGNKTSAAFVIVDERGRVLDQKLFYLPEKNCQFSGEQWERIIEIMEEHRPGVILVACRTIEVRDLFHDIEKELKNRRTSPRKDRKSNSFDISSIHVQWAEDDTARIYENSSRGVKEWPESAPIIRYCISLARRHMNPLFELCSLSESEILQLDPNPMSMIVGREVRVLMLHRAYVNVVNLVGVDINGAVQTAWHRSPLKYVCGLGVSKADALVKKIANLEGGRIISRESLETLMGPCVFQNCASFLRIKPATSSNSRGKSLIKDPLDDTRIHPENYPLARKMAADAMESLDTGIMDDEESSDVSCVRLVMSQPEKLEDLLLDEYAKELVKRGQNNKHLTLLDIKAELQHPYADLRMACRPPSDDALFEMLTGESERSLWVGGVIRATVTRFGSPCLCRLQSGVVGVLDSSNRFRQGQNVLCRVDKIDVRRMEVSLAEHRPGSRLDPRFGVDPYYKEPFSTSNESKPRLQAEKPVASRRVIPHPAFRDVSRREAESILKGATLGEVVIRLSEGGNLTVTWKIDDDYNRTALYQHLEIKESDKSGNAVIGRKLTVLGEVYEDLDEVIARCVEPMASLLREVRATPKFLPLSGYEARPLVESHLETERRKDPSRIAYCLTLARDRPGNVMLSYQPSSKAYHELVQVTPRGFILRDKNFDRIEDLIFWFKQNYRK